MIIGWYKNYKNDTALLFLYGRSSFTKKHGILLIYLPVIVRQRRMSTTSSSTKITTLVFEINECGGKMTKAIITLLPHEQDSLIIWENEASMSLV